MEQHICKNCGTTYTDGFCNHCGQKTAHRITMGHIGHDVLHAFTHADKGIIYLFLQLFIRPGIVAREYIIEGKRKKYFSPFQYVLIVGSIAAFVMVNSHFMENTMAELTPTIAPGPASVREMQYMKLMTNLQTKYYNFIVLLQLPFFAFASFLWYRKFKYNYAEHLTLQTFITSQTTIFGMLIILVVAMSGKPGFYIASIISLFSTSFQVYAYTQFFGERSFKGVLRALASAITGFLFFTLFIATVSIITAIIIIVGTKK